MSNLQQVADYIRNAAKRYEHMVVVADELDKLGSIQNAVADTEARLKEKYAEEARLNQAIHEAKAKVAAEDAKKAEVLKNGERMVVEITANARRAGAEAMAAAEAEAKAIGKRAAAEANEMMAAADKRRRDVDLAMEKSRAELVEAANLIASRRVELDEVTAKLTAAREQIQRLLS